VKYAILVTFALALLAAVGPIRAQEMHFSTGAAELAPEFYPGCSSIGNAGHFRLIFSGVQYDYARNESFWLYVLEWDGTPPVLDELIIGTGDCIIRATIITACPAGYTISVDGSTGIYGIKWRAQPAIARLHISFLVRGIYQVGPVPYAVKAGDSTYTGTICGVICEEECELGIVCPPNVTVDCQDSTDPENTGEAFAEGTCPPITVTYSDVDIPGACPQEKTIERTWTAEDSSGLVRTCVQLIDVVDDEAPVLTCASDITLGCNEEVVFTDPEVSDNCDPNPTLVPSGPFVVMGPGPCQATHTMCWYGVDACGNESEQCCQSITVTIDEEAPTLICARNRTIPCTEEVVFDEPEVSDNCDPDPVVSIQSTTTTPGPGPGEITHTRCWIAEDYCENVAEPCCQVIVQIDEEPPVLSCAPDGEVGCNDPVVFTEPEATDNCDTDPEIVEVSYIIAPGPGRCEETHTKCWVAYDDAGNQSNQCCQSIVRMVDEEPPQLVAAPDGQVACNQEPVFTDPEVSDNCDDNPVVEVVSETVSPGAVECDFIYTKCWRARDECGNVSEQVCQQITGKQDEVNPILTCQGDKEIEWGEPVIFDDPDVWDNCPGMPPIGEGGDVVTTVLDDGRQTFEKCWITFDPCGNLSNECCQVITMKAEPEPYCTFGCWDWAAACLSEDYNHDISTFPACIRDEHFDDLFFQGVLVGLEDPPYHNAWWGSAAAIEAFECSYGIPKVLDRDYVNPERIELRGVLVGEILALKLNREFSCAGYFSGLGYPAGTSCYGEYVIPDSVAKFAGLTVDEFLVIANRAVGGDTDALTPYGANLMQLWQATVFLNSRFSDCGGRRILTAGPPTAPEDSGEETPDDEDPGMLSAAPGQLKLNVQPNPLQGSTTIELDLPASGDVQVCIYDIQGRKISTVIEGRKDAGSYSAVWNGDDAQGAAVASGVYFCRARVGNGPIIMEKLIKY
jgi:hypothetical protein